MIIYDNIAQNNLNVLTLCKYERLNFFCEIGERPHL